MRIRFFLFCAAAISLAPGLAQATGGDGFDEPAMTLGETLDFLPGKSLGEIFLETSPELKDDGNIPDFERELTLLTKATAPKPPSSQRRT